MDQNDCRPRKTKSENHTTQHEKSLYLNLSTAKCTYTMLRDSSTFSSTECMCRSDDSVKQQCPLSEQYLRRLQDAEQSVSNRDILISMLQEQLNKLEELYKNHLDEHQEVRFKYCLVTQEFSNLKKICEKLEQENKVLICKCAERTGNDQPEIAKLKEEASKWKLQFEELLEKFEQVKEHTLKISSNENDSEESVDKGNEFKLIIQQYDHIEQAMVTQNNKLDIVIEKLGDLKSTNNLRDKVTAGIAYKENVNKEDALMQTEKGDQGDDTEKYKKKIELLELEIEKLQQENKSLEKEIQHNEQLASAQHPARSNSSGILPTASAEPTTEFKTVKDSILQIYKKENLELKELLILAADELEEVLKIDLQNNNEASIQGVNFSYIRTSATGRAIKTVFSGNSSPEDKDESNVNVENESNVPSNLKTPKSEQEIQTDDIDTQELEDIKHQNQILERKLSEAIKDLQTSKQNEDELYLLQNQFKELQEEHADLNNTLAETLETLERYKIQAEQQISEKEVLEMQDLINKLQSDISKLENELEKEKRFGLECNKLLDINQNALNDSQTECNKLKVLISKLEEDLLESRSKEQSKEDLEEMKSEIEKLSQVNDEKENKLLETLSKLEQLESEIAKLNTVLEKEREDSARQIIEFKGIYKDFEERTYKEEKRLKQELLKKDEEIKLLTDQHKTPENQMANVHKDVKDKCICTSISNQSGKKEHDEMQRFIDTLFQENQDLRNLLNKLINSLEAKLNNLILQSQSQTKIGENSGNQTTDTNCCQYCEVSEGCATKKEEPLKNCKHISSKSLPDLNREESEEIKCTCYALPKDFKKPNVEVLYTNNNELPDQLEKAPFSESETRPGKVQARILISSHTTYAKMNGAKNKCKTTTKPQINGKSSRNADERLGSRNSYLRVNVAEQLKNVQEQLAVTNELEKEIDKLQKDLSLRHLQMVHELAKSREDIHKDMALNMKDSKGQFINDLLAVQSTLLGPSKTEELLLEECRKIREEFKRQDRLLNFGRK